MHQLLERLSARLGPEQVQAPMLLADHRPEHMQQWRPAAEVLGRPPTRRSATASAGSGAEAALASGVAGFFVLS